MSRYVCVIILDVWSCVSRGFRGLALLCHDISGPTIEHVGVLRPCLKTLLNAGKYKNSG